MWKYSGTKSMNTMKNMHNIVSNTQTNFIVYISIYLSLNSNFDMFDLWPR